ncbi:MAG: bifunctional riboflavin kinase/FMN adenylyltransferase, partial [Clostridia bacterium]|nr:bifunctional riboflavin kinase/FMN adenylyltransferase [Clostridia bacterium]
MQILTVTDLHQPLPPCPRRVALGVFDGLHIGHHAVLSHTLDGFDRPCVLTFSHAPKAASPLLGEQEEARRLEQLGIKEWIRVDFSLIRDMSPEAFVTDFLHRTLGAVAVCCG